MYVSKDFRLSRRNNGEICGIFIVVQCNYLNFGEPMRFQYWLTLRLINLLSCYLWSNENLKSIFFGTPWNKHIKQKYRCFLIIDFVCILEQSYRSFKNVTGASTDRNRPNIVRASTPCFLFKTLKPCFSIPKMSVFKLLNFQSWLCSEIIHFIFNDDSFLRIFYFIISS